MTVEPFRVPDRVFAILSIVIVAVVWGMLIWAWPFLPSQIPTHFGPNGAADAFGQKNLFNVFFPAVLPTILGLFFLWLYRHPYYSNIPSSIMLKAIPEPEQTVLIKLIRHLLVILFVILSLIFAYISLATISGAIGSPSTLNPWLIFGLVIFMLLVVTMYTVWMTKITHRAIARIPKQG